MKWCLCAGLTSCFHLCVEGRAPVWYAPLVCNLSQAREFMVFVRCSLVCCPVHKLIPAQTCYWKARPGMACIDCSFQGHNLCTHVCAAKGSAVGGELSWSVLLNVKEKHLAWLGANDMLFASCILQCTQVFNFIQYRQLWGKQHQMLAWQGWKCAPNVSYLTVVITAICQWLHKWSRGIMSW